MKSVISLLLLAVLGALVPVTLKPSTAWAQANAPNCSVPGQCTTKKEALEYVLNTYLAPTKEGVYPIEGAPDGTILATAGTGNQETTWTKEGPRRVTVVTTVANPPGQIDGRNVAFVEEHQNATVGQLIEWSRNIQLSGLQQDNPDEQCTQMNSATSVTFPDRTRSKIGSATNYAVCGCFSDPSGTFTCPNFRITTTPHGVPNGGPGCTGC